MRLVVEAMNICNADQAHLPQIKSSEKCNVSYADLKAASVKFLWAALTLRVAASRLLSSLSRKQPGSSIAY